MGVNRPLTILKDKNQKGVEDVYSTFITVSEGRKMSKIATKLDKVECGQDMMQN